MSKKIISVALAIVLALSCFAVSAFALGGLGYEDADATYTQAWELVKVSGDGAGEWKYDVRLTANYKVGAIQFTVNTAVETGSVALASFAASSVIPTEWEADVSCNVANGKIMINANPTTDAVYAFDAYNEGNGVVIGTLTFNVAAESKATVKIQNDPKTATTAGTLIAARMSDDNVVTGTPIVGQTVTGTGDDQLISTVTAANDPVLAGVNGGYVDTANKYVYGIPAGDDATGYFTVTDGTFTVTAGAGGSGTGSTLTVYNSNNEVFDTYTVIIFGDVDGNGVIDTTDTAYTKAYASGDRSNIVSASQATLMAADVTDGVGTTVDLTDVAYMKAYNIGDHDAISVNPTLNN